MINPRELINQKIKGHFIPTELMHRREESLTFKALDSRSQRPVILKYYPPLKSPELQQELASALRFQASHRGPRVVPVVDFGPHPSGGSWVATELQEGRVNLQRYVRSQPQGRLAASECIALLSALCDSLESLHEQGLYHGNLKPTNIFLNERGEPSSVKISDAVGSSLCGVHKIEGERVTFNDPTFFSYEQASGKGASAQSDICALGLIGYLMLTGRFPFEGRTTDKLLAAVIIGSGRLKIDAEELGGADDAELKGLIELLTSCYAKSLSKRPAKLSALKSSLTALGAPSSSPSPELRTGPQTIGPADASVIFGSRGPQTMMYQSVDDESLAMLEAARAEFESEYGPMSAAPAEPLEPVATPPQHTLMSMGRVPMSPSGQHAIQSAPLSESHTPAGAFQTMMGLQLSDEERADLDELDTTPPEATTPPAPEAGFGDFEGFDLDALSRSMEEALLEVSTEGEASFEPKTLLTAGGATPPAELTASLEPPHVDDERPYYETHTTSSPSLELPFASSAPADEQLSDQHVELFSEPAQILPPAPATGEQPKVHEPPTYVESYSPFNPSTATQSNAFDTHLEGYNADELFPQLPGWPALMALKDKPQELMSALTQVRLPLKGHLLPFSQFQLQLEGHRFEDPFFDEPVERLSLEQLLPSPEAPSEPIPNGPLLTGSFESEAPSVISAVVEGAAPTTSLSAQQALPSSVLITALALVIGAALYFSGAYEMLSATLDRQAYVAPADPPPPGPSPTATPQALGSAQEQAPQEPAPTQAAPEDNFDFDEPTPSGEVEATEPAAKVTAQEEPPLKSKRTATERVKEKPSETRASRRARSERRKASSKARASQRARSTKKPRPSAEREAKSSKRAKTQPKKKTVPGLKSVF